MANTNHPQNPKAGVNTNTMYTSPDPENANTKIEFIITKPISMDPTRKPTTADSRNTIKMYQRCQPQERIAIELSLKMESVKEIIDHYLQSGGKPVPPSILPTLAPPVGLMDPDRKPSDADKHSIYMMHVRGTKADAIARALCLRIESVAEAIAHLKQKKGKTV
jgi:hypothetical protein